MRWKLDVKRSFVHLDANRYLWGAHAEPLPIRPRSRVAATCQLRPVMTSSIAVRYSLLPRTSVIGRAALKSARNAASLALASVPPLKARRAINRDERRRADSPECKSSFAFARDQAAEVDRREIDAATTCNPSERSTDGNLRKRQIDGFEHLTAGQHRATRTGEKIR